VQQEFLLEKTTVIHKRASGNDKKGALEMYQFVSVLGTNTAGRSCGRLNLFR